MFDLQFWGLATAVQVAKIRPGGSIINTTGKQNSSFHYSLYLIPVLFLEGAAMYRPRPGFSLLCGLAGSLSALARGLAVDLAPIRVNSICPGIVKTEVSVPYIIEAYSIHRLVSILSI